MSTATVSNRDKLFEVLAALSNEQIDAATPFIEDVAEAAKVKNLGDVDRGWFRNSLNLPRLFNPTITDLDGVVLPDKSKPLAARIKDGGYDYPNPDITADRFPITLDAGPRSLVLAHFGVNVRSDEVKGWAEANGFELALHEDLEAVGAHPKYKDLQREFMIVQLGSSVVINDYRSVSYLDGYDAQRRLELNYYGAVWFGSCRFLLVRKVSQSSGSLALGA